MSVTRALWTAIVGLVVLMMLVGGGTRVRSAYGRNKVEDFGGVQFYWQAYRRLDGYCNGVRSLVSVFDYTPENKYNQSEPVRLTEEQKAALPKEPPLEPRVYSPYPDYSSPKYTQDHHGVKQCFLDADEKIPAPDVYAYPGVPQHYPLPFYGSYSELRMRDDMCFERFGRLGPYGFGYDKSKGGQGVGLDSEYAGSEKVFAQSGYIDYSKIDWGLAQRRCHEKNAGRFEEQSGAKKRVQRQAYVLRTWAGYNYTDTQILTLRAMINELSLKSGGEYDVHFLVHIKNNSIPIWADEGLYNKTLQANIPREFWGISTLWSEQQMKMYYPAPFPDNFANMAGSAIHGVYRSAHFALQWFSQQHPEYDFIWNWEMDLRYTGHYYELNDRIGEWAKQQPRKGLWERGKRFWFPKYHGSWNNFTKFVEREIQDVDIPHNNLKKNGPVPIWGPVQDFKNSGMLPPPRDCVPPMTYEKDNYEWGVGEDADLMVFNPLFDPSTTNWVFRADVSGYDASKPIPPRRAAIITVARLSKRLLNIMHEEVWSQKHTMFPEMWPATVSLHHGLKAVYIPHPVYFDRDWEVGYMNDVFNYPKSVHASPFGWGENNLLGSTFYYNSGFSGALWRRWLGQRENEEGGKAWEEGEMGMGRMCLRPVLHHPVKRENGPTD